MRKSCKRKVYPKTNTIALAIEGAAITGDIELDKLRMRELQAIDAMAQGAATLDDFSDVIAMLNLCEHLARAGVGPEALPACESAEAAIMALCARVEQTGKMEAPAATELKSIRDVFAYLDLQRQSVSRSEFERAIKKTVERVKNSAPGVIEL